MLAIANNNGNPCILHTHVQEQQRRAGNQTHAKLDIDVAVALAHVNSIVYCEPPNIQAWNCSRCDPGNILSINCLDVW